VDFDRNAVDGNVAHDRETVILIAGRRRQDSVVMREARMSV
jgi:hypothetical protein